jgi:hypothetical protein
MQEIPVENSCLLRFRIDECKAIRSWHWTKEEWIDEETHENPGLREFSPAEIGKILRCLSVGERKEKFTRKYEQTHGIK